MVLVGAGSLHDTRRWTDPAKSFTVYVGMLLPKSHSLAELINLAVAGFVHLNEILPSQDSLSFYR